MTGDKPLKERHQIALDSAAAGILALLVDAREELMKDKAGTKTEVLLDRAGLSLDDISAVTGKKYNAVRMTITRDRRR